MNIRFPCALALMLVITCSRPLLAETPESLFQRGVEAFREEDWQAAISHWQEVEQGGWASGQLYYNLGNASYRMGAIGRAVVYFERARRLEPRDPDIRQNLALARMATVDRIEEPLRLVIWNWVDTVRDSLSLRELARLVAVLGLISVAGVALWYFGPTHTRRRVRVVVPFLVIIYVIGLSWYGWRTVLDARPVAVVLESKVDVYSAPDSAATQVFTLHEGTIVLERDIVAGWKNVVLPDGRTGWLPAEVLERI